MGTRRKFSQELKETAIRQMAPGTSAAEVARSLDFDTSDLYPWHRELEEHGASAFTGGGRKRSNRPQGPPHSKPCADELRLAVLGDFLPEEEFPDGEAQSFNTWPAAPR